MWACQSVASRNAWDTVTIVRPCPARIILLSGCAKCIPSGFSSHDIAREFQLIADVMLPVSRDSSMEGLSHGSCLLARVATYRVGRGNCFLGVTTHNATWQSRLSTPLFVTGFPTQWMHTICTWSLGVLMSSCLEVYPPHPPHHPPPQLAVGPCCKDPCYGASYPVCHAPFQSLLALPCLALGCPFGF